MSGDRVTTEKGVPGEPLVCLLLCPDFRLPEAPEANNSVPPQVLTV